jgi:carbon storage regulator CsrA
MLILSRRTDQKIVFPTLDITLNVLKIRGGVAKIGIDAPREIPILREEVSEARAAEAGATSEKAGITSDDRHELRNRLNTAGIAVHLAKRQMQLGKLADAEKTLDRVVTAFQAADSLLESMRPLPIRALLVDDDQNERDLLASYLTSFGYEVQVAADGVEALETLQDTDQPDIVLMDMSMPRCDGPKAIRHIRETPSLEGLRVFGVSGSTPEEAGVPVGTDGVNGWFRKPLDPEALMRQIRTATTTSQIGA